MKEKNDFFAYAKNYLNKCVNSGFVNKYSTCAEKQMVGFSYSKSDYKECTVSNIDLEPSKTTRVYQDAEFIKNSKITYSPVIFVNDKAIRVTPPPKPSSISNFIFRVL